MLEQCWDTNADELFFDFTELIEYAKSLPITKHSVLKFGSKIFDPLSFLSLFTVRVKILLQQFCLTRAHWDSELNGDFRKTYLKLFSELKTLNSTRIPRALYKNDSNPVSSQIHGFSDASEAALAGVVYLRTEIENGEIDVRQVTSKMKVLPPLLVKPYHVLSYKEQVPSYILSVLLRTP